MSVRFITFILLATGISGNTFASNALSAPALQMDVYIVGHGDCARQIGYGRLLTSSIYRKIGIQIKWHEGEPGADRKTADGQVIVMRTVEKAPVTATPYALAAAQNVGLSGVSITIFGDRIRRFLSDHPSLRADAVGYVVAHELGHVIQGVPRHSESGIMKAVWSNEDYSEMMFRQLQFTALDVNLIHQHLGSQAAAEE